MNILIIIAVVAVLLLLFEFLRQVSNVRHGRTNVGRGRVFLNRFLVLVLVVSVVGIGFSAYADHRQAKTQEVASVTPKQVESTSQADPVSLNLKREVKLNDNGEAKIKIMVSANTKVVIRGKRTNTEYAEFKSPKNGGMYTKTVTLDYSGDYKVTATRGKKKVVKNLTVKDNDNEDESSSSSIASSSSSSASSSSRVSSSSSSSLNSNNNSNNTAASSAGRSNSGYRGGYSGGNSYRQPAASAGTAAQPNYSVQTTVGQ